MNSRAIAARGFVMSAATTKDYGVVFVDGQRAAAGTAVKNWKKWEKPSRKIRRAIMKAKLTPEQDHHWEQLFSWAKNSGYSDARADEEAWRGLCEEWPELEQFQGCEP
jgi:hypothetical protein